MSNKVINKLKAYADQLEALPGVEVSSEPVVQDGDTFILNFAVTTNSPEEEAAVDWLLTKVDKLIDKESERSTFDQSGTTQYQLTYDVSDRDFDLNTQSDDEWVWVA